jgi:hypothetical protein
MLEDEGSSGVLHSRGRQLQYDVKATSDKCFYPIQTLPIIYLAVDIEYFICQTWAILVAIDAIR